MTTFLLVVAGAAVGYAATVYADYLIHRNVWHGRWRIVHRGPFRWLLHPHYVHHLKAHHRHAAEHPELLFDGDPIPTESHETVEAKYEDRWHVHHGLRCTDHGITIRGPACHLHYLAVFLVTPQPYVALGVGLLLGWPAGVAAAVMPLCAVVTQVLHKYYHMTPEARAERAPRWLRWAVRSREFGRLADQHQKHHYDGKFADDYYGVLPFGHWLLRPILGKN